MYQKPRYIIQKHGKVMSFICLINYIACIKFTKFKNFFFFLGMGMCVSEQKGVVFAVAYTKLFHPL